MQNVVQKQSLESRQPEALLPNEGVGRMEVCPGPCLCERLSDWLCQPAVTAGSRQGDCPPLLGREAVISLP